MADTTTTSVPVATAGRLHRQRQRRVRNGAHAVLALGGGVLLFTALRPLPAPATPDAPELPAISAIPLGSDAVDARERRLAELSTSGNVFAADRLAWQDEQVELATNETEDAPVEPDETGPVSPGAAKPGVGPIRLTERPTAAASKSRDALELVGVYVSGERRVAMIRGGEPDRKKDVELYGEDDVFYGDTWRLLRVVPEHDRVILEHLGHGDILALSMYDYEIPSVAAADEPLVDEATLAASAAREEMLEAGVAQEDVEDVFEMLAALERGEDVQDDSAPVEDPDQVAANEPPKPDGGSPPGPREMPEELSGLLRSMILDAQRSKAKPPTPSEDPDQN